MSPRKPAPKSPRTPRAKAAAPIAAPAVPTVLMLRTCAADLTAHGGFCWPKSGPVECPDWNPAPECGGGLHGLLWGEGDASLLSSDADARWLVWSAVAAEVVAIDSAKAKAPRGVVVYCGDRDGATAYLRDHGGHGRAIVYGTATAGDDGTATAGARGTATAGYAGTATAGYAGTATAGDDGTIVLLYRDSARGRYRRVLGEIGITPGLEPGVPYRLDDAHAFVRADRGSK